jgi:AsmA protein
LRALLAGQTFRGTMATSRPRARVLRFVLAVLVLLAGLGVLVAFLFDTSAIAERVKERALPEVAAKIGRPITAGPVEASILPLPSARIAGLRVGGRTPADPPLLETGEARVKVAIWPLVRSLGKEVRAKSVELTNPSVNVEKRADGSWSFQDILDRLAAAPPAPAGPPTAEAPAERRVVIDRFVLVDGAVHLVDRTTGGRRTDVTGIDVSATGVGSGEKLRLEVAANVGAGQRNAKLDLTVDPLPEGSLAALPPDRWPDVSGQAKATAIPFSQLEGFLPAGLAAVVTGGQVNLDARISTGEDGLYTVAVDGGLAQLALRGQPASGSLRAVATAPKGNPKALTVEVSDAKVTGPGVDLVATARLEGLPPAKATFDVSGQKLDLDALLGALPPSEPEATPKPAGQGPISPEMQARLQNLTVDGSLSFAQVVRGHLTATDVKAKATLRGGTLALEQAGARLYGGTVELGGTTVDLTRPAPAWKLEARLDAVDLARAMTEIAGVAPVAGGLGGSLDVAGRGAEWTDVRTNATGDGALRLQGGVLRSADLGAALATRLGEGLARLGRAGGPLPKGGQPTRLRDLLLSFSVQDGWLRLDRPITVESSFGTATLEGRIGLDQSLDLEGTAQLAPGFVAQASGGKLRPDGPVEVPVQIAGNLTAPEVGALDTDALARSVLPRARVEREVRRQAGQAEEKAKREAKRRARDVFKGIGGG